jgi:tetratricopeptide (TPR) repeat protein
MARVPNCDDPLAAVRRSVRHPESRGAVEIALFRLPARQRELVRRYDLERERAHDIQHALGLSPRQFFRDRRQALSTLSAHLTDENPPVPREVDRAARTIGPGFDVELAGRTYARSLAQSGNARCLDVLRTLAANAQARLDRADLLLELADTAADFGDELVSIGAMNAAGLLLSEEGSALEAWLHGRLARLRARLTGGSGDTASLLAQALALLRRSVALDPTSSEARAALTDVLFDAASLHFLLGAHGRARAALAEATNLIERFGLRGRPKALEILAFHAAIDACVTGRTKAAVTEVWSLLRLAAESAWSSTACRLSSYLVGLNAISGEYGQAIAWYRRMVPFCIAGVPPSARANLAMEAAHAYSMSGHAHEALSVIGYIRPERGCPRDHVPSWHAVAATALVRLGDESAMAEAYAALAGYSARNVARGVGDAHRLLALCYAKRGDARSAREHIAEARRLTERYGVPYALLLTLISEAAIVRSTALHQEASEYARLLQRLAVI